MFVYRKLMSISGLLLVLSSLSPSEASPVQSNKVLIAAKKEAPSSDPVVTMETSKGTIKILIFRKEAPITAGNFVDLVQKGFYNGLTFHRYEPGFVVQGGDPQGNGMGAYVDPKTREERRIPLETKTNLRHGEPGMIAMARSGDPNSASCQFYFTLAACPQLDGAYAVFGKVMDGLPVIMNLRKGDKIVKASVAEPGSK